jgi:hypothetical protein
MVALFIVRLGMIGTLTVTTALGLLAFAVGLG